MCVLKHRLDPAAAIPASPALAGQLALLPGKQAIKDFMDASRVAQQHHDALRGSLVSLLMQFKTAFSGCHWSG